MREKLRYIGPPTAEFETGTVYKVLIEKQDGCVLISRKRRRKYRYESQPQLLADWQSFRIPYAGANT